VDTRVTKMPDFKRLLKTLNTTDEEVVSVATLFIGGGNFGIQKRTRKGRDADGKSFDSYSTKPYFFNIGSKASPKYKTFKGGYKEFRVSQGRTAKPNLTFHGQMLHGMRVKKYRGGAKIYFKGKENDKASWNHKTRKFFALDDKQVNYMYKRIGTFIVKGLK